MIGDKRHMLKLKPITIIALDALAAGFCAEVRKRLTNKGDGRGRLIQMYVLVHDGASLRFEGDLGSVADTSFDLRLIANVSKGVSAEQAGELFNEFATKLEPHLIFIISGTHQDDESDATQYQRIEIVGPHLIYLVMSSTDQFASGVLIEAARLIRWLFATRFADDPFSLESVILLPELFAHAEETEYANAYALLKKIDYSTDEGIIITALQKAAPFEFCWIIDGRRSRSDYLGSLAENLPSYCDAFAGFLTAEPETSGALNTHKLRGKTPAYSTFGYAELFFPCETAITRLSASFASDIISLAFVPERKSIPERKRKLLLDVKHFVLKTEFSNTLNDIQRDKGADIRPPFFFTKKVREGRSREHVNEMRASYDKYKREDLLKAQNLLESRRAIVLADLVNLLDSQLDHIADADTSGLYDALEWLDLLTDPLLPLDADMFSEPKNLITEQLDAEALLDECLAVTPNNEQTKALLDKVNELNSRLGGARTTLRLMPIDVDEPVEAEKAPAKIDERDKALNEIAEINTTLAGIRSDYEKAFNQERAINLRARKEAGAKTREAKREGISESENGLIKIDDELRETKRRLLELRQERGRTIRRYFFSYPIMFLIGVAAVHIIIALAGLAPPDSMIDFYSTNIAAVFLIILVIGTIYAFVVWANYIREIDNNINKVKDVTDGLSRRLESSSHILRNLYEDEASFEYQLHAQRMRTETILDLIEASRQKAEELRDTLEMLIRNRTLFNQQRELAIPISSRLRQSVLHADDIDAYYESEVTNKPQEAEGFAINQIRRSHVRRVSEIEFREKLSDFTRERFRRLEDLSLGNILTRQPNFMSSETAQRRIHDQYLASQPLLRLRELDSNRDKISQRGSTLWMHPDDRDKLYPLYNSVTPQVSHNTHDDKRAVRLLTRWLYFPAYFLAQIDYFRTCYNRHPVIETKFLPDLVPSELKMSKAARRALEEVVQANALGLIQRQENGNFYFAHGKNVLLGSSLSQIAERFVTDFASQKLYAELSNALKPVLMDTNKLYEKLIEFRDLTSDLDPTEQEALDTLLQKYHPLR